MIFVIAVSVGIAIFCFVKGYIVVGIIALGGISPKFGFIALIITSIFLFTKGHWIVGIIPLLVIGWNLIGLARLGSE